MAHGSYRPRRYETEKNRKRREEFLRYEIREAQSTMRICKKCCQFNHFIFLNYDIQYLHMTCPICGEIIQVTRLINLSDERKWR
ncbi:MAG TPA: hypothetical protein VMX55_00390 [candidate division Zixibacteria bacterium]|nr:hypothetical protein [candidate division Zixibacteria bacterium]